MSANTLIGEIISERVRGLLDSGASYPLAKEYGIKSGVNLASNECPYPPSPKAVKAAILESKKLNVYPDPAAKELKNEIARYLGVGVENVVVGNGSDEIIDLICRAFINQNDRALVPLPTFSMYELACRSNGGLPKFFQLQEFEWRADELADALADVKLAFIARPNNPTGNGISPSGLCQLLKSGKIIVVDEAYAEFAGYSAAKLVQKYENLIVLRTFSKAFALAGVRIGYAIASRDVISILEKIRAPFNVNRIAQAAAAAALRDIGYLKKIVEKIKKEKKYLRDELLKLGIRVFPSDANFLMADVSYFAGDASTICNFLERKRIFIRELTNVKGAGRNYVRITVGTPQQNKKLIFALKKIKKR